MITGLYTSASGLQAQEYRNSITANNLANAQTTGFKRDLALVLARPNPGREHSQIQHLQSPALRHQGSGALVAPTGIDLSQATLQQTHNKTDLALDGRGFFMVQTPDNQHRLTRDGRFLLANDGTLVTAAQGLPVLDANLQPIKLNPALPIVVSNRGEISQAEGTSVQLAVMDVKDPRQLTKQGANLLAVSDPAALTPATARTAVRQGMLENSGVDPVVEMVNMLEGQRIFEANARMITYQDQTLQQLNQIGRVA